METFQQIITAVFILFVLALSSVGLFWFLKFLVIYPLSLYYTKRGTNRLQWRANESSASRENRINGNLESETINDFYLDWRILPSELPYLIRVYGYNDWESFVQTKYIKFNNEQEFKDFVGKLKTRKDLINYYNKVDNKIVWYEP